MAKAAPIVHAHWYHMIEGLQASPTEFYAAVERAIAERQVPDTKISRVDYREGSLVTAKREYLRVKRRQHIFDICGAPFGNGFFVSWWLGEPQGCLSLLAELPFVGGFLESVLKPLTYYMLDTALMFQASVHNAVQQVIGEMTEAKGLRALTEAERKPVMREFFQD